MAFALRPFAQIFINRSADACACQNEPVAGSAAGGGGGGGGSFGGEPFATVFDFDFVDRVGFGLMVVFGAVPASVEAAGFPSVPPAAAADAGFGLARSSASSRPAPNSAPSSWVAARIQSSVSSAQRPASSSVIVASVARWSRSL